MIPAYFAIDNFMLYRGAYTTQSNIYNGAFIAKIALNYIRNKAPM